MAGGILVDSNVLLDILTEDPVWQGCSITALSEAAETGPLHINPVIYSEVCSGGGRCLQRLTRDDNRYRVYLPTVSLLAPTDRAGVT